VNRPPRARRPARSGALVASSTDRGSHHATSANGSASRSVGSRTIVTGRGDSGACSAPIATAHACVAGDHSLTSANPIIVAAIAAASTRSGRARTTTRASAHATSGNTISPATSDSLPVTQPG
jgi:hypothetical protein